MSFRSTAPGDKLRLLCTLGGLEQSSGFPKLQLLKRGFATIAVESANI